MARPDSQEMFFGVSCMVYGMVAAPGQDVSYTIQYRPWNMLLTLRKPSLLGLRAFDRLAKKKIISVVTGMLASTPQNFILPALTRF